MISDLDELLGDLASRHGVPGASMAVLAEGAVHTAVTGVLNVATGVDATPDSLFPTASVGKVHTATVLMRLCEAGVVTLDDPIVRYLPEFRLAEPGAAQTITVRHLLTHTSGIDGDFTPDTGRGDDCLEKFVGACADAHQIHAAGATMSYCNSGFMLLGRLVEQVTGKVWDDALREWLIDPLDLRHTVTLPEDALRFRVAWGHAGRPGGQPEPAPLWAGFRAITPAGANLCTTPSELIALARVHLNDGLTADGRRLLSADSVAMMQQPQTAVPDRWTLGSHWGLGWALFGWGGGVYGHDGNGVGTSAFLRIVPGEKVAIALMTNGGDSRRLYEDIYPQLLGELAGVSMPPPLRPPESAIAVDVGDCIGTYERAGERMEVVVRDDHLSMTVTPTGELDQLLGEEDRQETLIPVDRDEKLFLRRSEGSATLWPLVFFTLPDGQRYVHTSARATPKVG